MTLIVQNVDKNYGTLQVFKNFGMEILENKITCILGPSGCGKTTFLHMLSRIIEADKGYFGGFDNKVISYLFQEPRLLDWKTVWGNIEFVLKDIYSKEKRQQIISQYIEMVGLKEFEHYYPSRLSGGMLQRVAIARAFAYPSDILLMDEPFKGLDVNIKRSLIKSFMKLWTKDSRTVIFVTHDIEEALMIGDEIHIFSSMPVQLKSSFQISIPQQERSTTDKYMEELKKQIYQEFTLINPLS
ncbi:ABC transporter ATP-binding protein [Clostridiaceae bacterium 35-E11]